MIDESIKKLLFEKNFSGDYRAFFIAIIDELSSLNRHIGKATTNSLIAIENDRIIFDKQKDAEHATEENTKEIKKLIIRDQNIEKISRSSLGISVAALFLIIIVGWQTTPVTMDKITKFASWLVDKL